MSLARLSKSSSSVTLKSSGLINVSLIVPPQVYIIVLLALCYIYYY